MKLDREVIVAFLKKEANRAVEGDNAISFLFIEERRYGTIEVFNDGDIMAMTSDRSKPDEEADVWAVVPTLEGLVESIVKVKAFVYFGKS